MKFYRTLASLIRRRTITQQEENDFDRLLAIANKNPNMRTPKDLAKNHNRYLYQKA